MSESPEFKSWFILQASLWCGQSFPAEYGKMCISTRIERGIMAYVGIPHSSRMKKNHQRNAMKAEA